MQNAIKKGQVRSDRLKTESFCRGESGSMIIFGLMIFVLMLMVGGMAVDLARYEAQRSRLQSTLDRAVLAAASLDQPLTPSAVVVDYFTREGLGAYIDATDVEVVNTLTARQVTATADQQVSHMFLTPLIRLVNTWFLNDTTTIPPMTAVAAGTAEESASRTEISLVVDVSGSMAWDSSSGNSKISELRDAAIEFVNIMQCNPSDPSDTVNCTIDPDTVSISLIPYAEYVQAGEAILDELNVTSEQTTSSCLYFEEETFTTVALDLSATYQRVAHFDPWRSRYSTPYRWACRIQNLTPILPFENEPADLRTVINNLDAGSYTSIDMGVKWGAAMLDPAFRPVVQGLVNSGNVNAAFNDRPFSYTENGIKKVLVVMTDGVNTTQNYLYDGFRDGPSGVWYNSYYDEYSIYRASYDQYYWTDHGHYHDHPQGDYENGTAVQLTFQELWQQVTMDWYDYWWWLPSPGSSEGRDFKNARLDEICSATKDQNITIFAIGFEVTEESAAVMENCASSPAHFFDVEGADLTDAFASIARAISALRLVN